MQSDQERAGANKTLFKMRHKTLPFTQRLAVVKMPIQHSEIEGCIYFIHEVCIIICSKPGTTRMKSKNVQYKVTQLYNFGVCALYM